jgi:hypothetical protein
MLTAANDSRNLSQAHEEALTKLGYNTLVLADVIHTLEMKTSKAKRILIELNNLQKKNRKRLNIESIKSKLTPSIKS